MSPVSPAEKTTVPVWRATTPAMTAAVPTHAAGGMIMGFFFQDSTSKTVWFAYAYSDGECASEGDPWSKAGWYMVTGAHGSPGAFQPGQRREVLLFAENQVRILCWGGEFFASFPAGHSTGAG